MVSLGTSILLMAFLQGGVGLTSTTTSQDYPTTGTTTTTQVTTQADTSTQGTTTSQFTTISHGNTTSQDTTTSPDNATSQGTTTPQSVTTLQGATTSQGATTPQTPTTSQRTTTSQGTTTTQGITTAQTTTTSQRTTTPQTNTISERTTTPQITTTSQGITTSQTTTTSQGTTTAQTTTTSETTTTSQGITTLQTTTTSHGTTTPQITTTSETTTNSQDITTPQTTTTSQGTTTIQTTATLHVTSTSYEANATSQATATSQSALTSQATSLSSSTTITTTPQSTIPTIHATTIIFPETTSTLQGTTSMRSPVSTPSKEPVSYQPDPGYYDLRLQFDVKVYLDFKDVYEDRTSLEFQSLATNFSVSLIQHFRSIRGFKSIEILQFSPGSVIVDYSVNVYATVDILAVTNQIENEVVDSLKEVAGAPVDIWYTRTSMKSRLGSLRTKDRCSLASANLCPFGYYCKLAGTATLLCIDRCNVSVCQNNGLCYIGHLSQDVQCKCPNSDGAIFTGERCETKQVVMTIQERNLYLIIACSIIGAVIFSFVLTVCIINRKRRILKKKLSINLRMKQGELHKTGVKYIRDEHNRYADGNEMAINRQRQNIFDTTDNPYQGKTAQNVDDGYIRAVEDVRGDDGYLRAAEGIRRKDDSEYDYIK